MYRKLLMPIIGITLLSLFFVHKHNKKQRLEKLRVKSFLKESDTQNNSIKNTVLLSKTINKENQKKSEHIEYSNIIKAKFLKYLYSNPESSLSIEDFMEIQNDYNKQKQLLQNDKLEKKSSKKYQTEIFIKTVLNNLNCDLNSELWIFLYNNPINNGFASSNGESVAPMISKKIDCKTLKTNIKFELLNKDFLLHAVAYLIKNEKIIGFGTSKYNNISFKNLLNIKDIENLSITLNPINIRHALINLLIEKKKGLSIKPLGLESASFSVDINYFNEATVRGDGLARFQFFPMFSEILLESKNNIFFINTDIPLINKEYNIDKNFSNILHISNIKNFAKAKLFIPSINQSININSDIIYLNLKKDSLIELYDSNILIGSSIIPKIAGKTLHTSISPMSLNHLKIRILNNSTNTYNDCEFSKMYIRYTDKSAKNNECTYSFNNINILAPKLVFLLSLKSINYLLYYRLKPIIQNINMYIISKDTYLTISRKHPTYPDNGFLYAFDAERAVAINIETKKATVSKFYNGDIFFNNLKPAKYLVYIYKNKTLKTSRFIEIQARKITIIEN